MTYKLMEGGAGHKLRTPLGMVLCIFLIFSIVGVVLNLVSRNTTEIEHLAAVVLLVCTVFNFLLFLRTVPVFGVVSSVLVFAVLECAITYARGHDIAGHSTALWSYIWLLGGTLGSFAAFPAYLQRPKADVYDAVVLVGVLLVSVGSALLWTKKVVEVTAFWLGIVVLVFNLWNFSPGEFLGLVGGGLLLLRYFRLCLLTGVDSRQGLGWLLVTLGLITIIIVEAYKKEKSVGVSGGTGGGFTDRLKRPLGVVLAICFLLTSVGCIIMLATTPHKVEDWTFLWLLMVTTCNVCMYFMDLPTLALLAAALFLSFIDPHHWPHVWSSGISVFCVPEVMSRTLEVRNKVAAFILTHIGALLSFSAFPAYFQTASIKDAYRGMGLLFAVVILVGSVLLWASKYAAIRLAWLALLYIAAVVWNFNLAERFVWLSGLILLYSHWVQAIHGTEHRTYDTMPTVGLWLVACGLLSIVVLETYKTVKRV